MDDTEFQGSDQARTALSTMMLEQDILPGADASYGLCKMIYVYHPLGLKMVEAPITLAFSQEREVSGVPEEVKNAFLDCWAHSVCNDRIADTMRQARIYGIATCAEVQKGVFSVFDPLVTAGSLVLNLDRLAPDFLKVKNVRVDNRTFTAEDCVVMMNEAPIYLQWTNSTFGYTGRSVYQRALYPMQTFLQSMITDNLVIQKAGVLVAKMKKVAAAVNRIMQTISGWKRNLLKEAKQYNVLQIEVDEEIETLNMQNTAEAVTTSRNNVLDNIAAACDMPSIILKSETLNEGFGEGTEDAKAIANYVNRFRKSMEPLYEFFVPRVQKAAWSEEFYEAFQNSNEEYKDIPFNVAFYEWQKNFEFLWPNLLTEPDSEKAKAAETRLDGVERVFNLLNASVSPTDRKQLVQWVMDSVNSEVNQILFPEPLILELDGDFEQAQPTELRGRESVSISDTEKDDAGPTSVADSAVSNLMDRKIRR
jgi:hypothetical protein